MGTREREATDAPTSAMSSELCQTTGFCQTSRQNSVCNDDGMTMGEKRSDEPTLAKCERLRVVLNVAQLSHPGAVSAWSALFFRFAHFNTLQHGAHISRVSKKGTKLTPKR